jgi:spore coat protein U-like protein
MKTILLPLLVLFLASPLLAASTTGTVPVSANVTAACMVGSGGGLAFPAFNPFDQADLASEGSMQVTCTKGMVTAISLDQGQNGADVGGTCQAPQRLMKSGPYTKSYQIYSDASHTQVWGCAAANALVYTSSSGATASTISVYGVIPFGSDGATVHPGSYSDIVTITVNY